MVEPQSKLGKTATLFGGKSPHFKYFVQGTTDVEEDRFVLSARKDFSDPFKTQFVMSTDPTPGFEPAGPQFFGRLSGNFVGSKYTLFDRGTIQPTMGSVSDQDERRVLGAIVYEGTVGKTGGGYRRLTALLPNTYRGIGKDGAQKVPRLPLRPPCPAALSPRFDVLAAPNSLTCLKSERALDHACV